METLEFPAIRCTLRAHRFHGLPECVETVLADACLVPMERDTFYLYGRETFSDVLLQLGSTRKNERLIRYLTARCVVVQSELQLAEMIGRHCRSVGIPFDARKNKVIELRGEGQYVRLRLPDGKSREKK